MKPAQLRKLFARDLHCWHCGDDRPEYLVPHHRKGRGMGGRKSLDTLTNVILVCARWNGQLEDNAQAAALGKQYGQKLEQWQDASEPVYDASQGLWYLLSDSGDKYPLEEEIWNTH